VQKPALHLLNWVRCVLAFAVIETVTMMQLLSFGWPVVVAACFQIVYFNHRNITAHQLGVCHFVA
jgi:hypothetical protein